MNAYTYLIVNLLTISICFVFSFHRKIRFDRYFLPFLKAAALIAVPFIAWDIWFTAEGVWWFSSEYTTGLLIFGLPIEEWMFFFFIPFSCVFTFFCLDKFFDLSRADRLAGPVFLLMQLLSLAVMATHYDKLYPFITALCTSLGFLWLYFSPSRRWIGRGTVVYIILLPGFFMVNGVLTGTGLASPVVNYNPDQILNIRMLTIPVEDAFYGYIEFLLILAFFKIFSRKKLGATEEPEPIRAQKAEFSSNLLS